MHITRTVARMEGSEMRDPHTKPSKGFTLLELLLTLSLISTITFLSLSYAPSLYKKNQLQTVSTEIKSAIHTAKMQALAKGKPLTLAPLSNTNDWSKGMLLFVDNPKHQSTPNTEPLYEWHWKSAGTDVFWHGFQSKDYLLFTTDLRSSMTNGYFVIKNTQQQIKLIVNRVGRVRIG